MISLSKSEHDMPYEGGSPLRGEVSPTKKDASARKIKPKAKDASPHRMSKAELRESNSSVRFAGIPSSNDSNMTYSPNRGRGGVGGPDAETPERYRRGSTKSPSGGAPRPILYKENSGTQIGYGSAKKGAGKGQQRGRSKTRGEPQSEGAREDSPAYKAAITRLHDVTRDKDQMEEDLQNEKKEKEFVKEDLERAYQHIDHLRRSSPPKGELQRLNGEN